LYRIVLLRDFAYERFRLLLRQVVCPSVVRLSVMSRYRDHIRWNYSKVMSRLV